MDWRARKIMRMLSRRGKTAMINDLIDLAVHPFFTKNETSKLIDFLLHAANEKDLEKSLKKFLRYNARKRQ